ncbi:MAG: hypothetical protein N4A70_05485 [Pelagimonas sp.]|jgi:hypothetical protein|nr:hypothetical protein [Pelagimonas sp.]
MSGYKLKHFDWALGMFRLRYHWLLFHQDPPAWGNDPAANRRMFRIIWRERNGIAMGRSVMAYCALLGWSIAGLFGVLWWLA